MHFLNIYIILKFRKVKLIKSKGDLKEDLKTIIISKTEEKFSIFDFFIINQNLFYISKYFEVSLCFIL